MDMSMQLMYVSVTEHWKDLTHQPWGLEYFYVPALVGITAHFFTVLYASNTNIIHLGAFFS